MLADGTRAKLKTQNPKTMSFIFGSPYQSVDWYCSSILFYKQFDLNWLDDALKSGRSIMIDSRAPVTHIVTRFMLLYVNLLNVTPVVLPPLCLPTTRLEPETTRTERHVLVDLHNEKKHSLIPSSCRQTHDNVIPNRRTDPDETG